MMLSDAAYGAIVAIACFVALKKYPRMSASMHKSLKLFFLLRIIHHRMGNLILRIFRRCGGRDRKDFFGVGCNGAPLWFAPLNNPMKLLIYSMAFGLVHLFVGLGIKGYMQIKDKQYLDFFCDVVLWYIFLIGLILMLIPSDIFASIAQMTVVFPPALNTLAKVLAIIGAVGLLLMSGRSSKNPVLRIALGAYDIYNITGWLSDVLSYSRLLALGPCDRSYRIRSQSDGKHVRRRRDRSHSVRTGLCGRTSDEPCDQPSGGHMYTPIVSSL